jgi:hypothetical protein
MADNNEKKESAAGDGIVNTNQNAGWGVRSEGSAETFPVIT